MIEAQAVGVPVLASAVDGIVEHVSDERPHLARAARASAETLDGDAIAQRRLDVCAQATDRPTAPGHDAGGR